MILDHNGDPYGVTRINLKELERYSFSNLSKASPLLNFEPDFFRLFKLDPEELTNPYAQHVWVHACISVIARSVSSVPYVIATDEEEDKNKRNKAPFYLNNPKRKKAFDMKRKGLTFLDQGSWHELFRDVNPLMTRSQLWDSTLIWLMLEGEVFWVLTGTGPDGRRKEDEIPSRIWPMNPKFFSISKKDKMGAPIQWKFEIPTKKGKDTILYQPHELVHFYLFNPENPLRGLSPLKAGLRGARADFKAALYNEAFYTNGADPGGIIKVKTSLTPEETEQLRTTWEDRHQGASKRQKLAVLENDMDYIPSKQTMRDMEFIKQRQWHRDEILALYGVPKFLVSLYEDINFATAKAAEKAFWIHTLIPLIKYIEDKLVSKFFGPLEDEKVFGMFDLSQVEALQEDVDKQIDRATKLHNLGFPPNAINDRLDLGMEKIAWGDTKFFSFNLVRAEELLEGVAPTDEGGSSHEDDDNTGHEDEDEDDDKGHRNIKNWIRKDTLGQFVERYIEKIIKPNENRFKSKMKNYFNDLRGEQIKLIEDFIDDVSKGKITVEVKEVEGKKVLALSAKELDAITFSVKKWDKILKKLGDPLYESIMEDATDSMRIELGELVSWNLNNPEALKLRAELISNLVKVNKTVSKQIRETIIKSLAQGDTIGDVAFALRQNVRGVFNNAASRSVTIARTEVGMANSGSRFEIMKAEGVKEHEWVTAGDENVRQSPQADHVIENGQTVKIGDRFPSTNLLHPHDSSTGVAAQVINCRCVTVAVVKRR